MNSKGFDVLVDMDNVLTDFDSAVEAGVQAESLYYPVPRPRRNFYIHKDYPKFEQERIKGIWQASGFFRKLPLMHGAIEGWAKIEEAGGKPRVCSSPILENPECINEKKDWLEENLVPHFGYSIIERAIFDRDKTKYDAVALVDDKPVLEGEHQRTWEHIVFDAPYNQDSTAQRLYGWHDPNLLRIVYGLIASREYD